MKKFNICLFILILFSGVVFYLGWTQIKVDSDKYGVFVSKTSGVCEDPIVPGEFSWHWELLLPTNAQIKQFSIAPQTIKKTIKGELPSGAIYSQIYSSTDNFSYSFDYTINVTISPQSIISLYKQNKITNNEDLTLYLQDAAEVIAQLAADYYLKKAKENPMFNLEGIRRDDVIKAIQSYKEYPEIEISTFAMTSSKVPDYKLYDIIQKQYLTTPVVTPNTDISVEEKNE